MSCCEICLNINSMKFDTKDVLFDEQMNHQDMRGNKISSDITADNSILISFDENNTILHNNR